MQNQQYIEYRVNTINNIWYIYIYGFFREIYIIKKNIFRYIYIFFFLVFKHISKFGLSERGFVHFIFMIFLNFFDIYFQIYINIQYLFGMSFRKYKNKYSLFNIFLEFFKKIKNKIEKYKTFDILKKMYLKTKSP